jgi:hypothetical protein
MNMSIIDNNALCNPGKEFEIGMQPTETLPTVRDNNIDVANVDDQVPDEDKTSNDEEESSQDEGTLTSSVDSETRA